MPEQPNGWTEWSKHVLIQLEKHDEKLDATGKEITEIKVLMAQMKVALDRLDGGHDTMSGDLTKVSLDVNTLKTKAGVWGGVAGAAVSVAAAVIIKLLGV